ncbi:MAG TPA: glutathione-dependent reductase, partial [Pseudomonas sp.]|nr:glutathione-dependent reductase [Pseudomonas sp.]
MGLLVDGQWQDRWYENSNDGEFQREQAQRRDWVTTDGSPGPDNRPAVQAQA